ncbi:unnamed protein product, partial [Oikopleura dioica]
WPARSIWREHGLIASIYRKWSRVVRYSVIFCLHFGWRGPGLVDLFLFVLPVALAFMVVVFGTVAGAIFLALLCLAVVVGLLLTTIFVVAVGVSPAAFPVVLSLAFVAVGLRTVPGVNPLRGGFELVGQGHVKLAVLEYRILLLLLRVHVVLEEFGVCGRPYAWGGRVVPAVRPTEGRWTGRFGALCRAPR